MEDDLNLCSEDKIREAFNDTGFIDFEGFKDLTSRVLKKVDTEEEPGRPLVEVVELAGAAELVARREDGAGVEKQRERRPHGGAQFSESFWWWLVARCWTT